MLAASTEAVAALERALGDWSQTQRGLWEVAGAQLSGACGEIAAEHGRRANRVAALEAMLSACRDERDAAAIRAELARARELLQRAERALALAYAAEQELGAARRRAGYALDPAISAARADLVRRLRSLDGYVSSASASTSATSGPAGKGRTAPTSALSAYGLQSVDLSEVDFTDNPIVGKFGEGGAELPDYRWAAETWDTLIRPGLGNGLTRDDFAARDAERQAPPYRATAIVFDLFVGDEAIVLERRPDGTFNVIRGRHRIFAARQLGIRNLPARVLP